MATEVSPIPVDAGAAGLDRIGLNASGEGELVPLSAGSESSGSVFIYEDAIAEEAHSTSAETTPQNDKHSSSKRHRLLHKTKAIFHVSPTKDDVVPTAPVLADARDTASDARLVSEPPKPKTHTAKDVLHHPVSTAISKATGQGGHQIASNLVSKEISHGHEVKVVRAQDEVDKPGTKIEVKRRKDALDVLVKERQDMFVRWTMDRHITKVRILPVSTVPKRSRKEFTVIGQDGEKKMDWESWAHHSAKYYAAKYGSRYVGYYSDPPEASKQTIMPAIEKLLIATDPLQTLTMSIRQVYRWDNRSETLKYLAIYSTLWIFDLLLPGMLAALIYLILHRRIHAPSIENMREDIKRVEDMTATSVTITEFIEKKGDQNWVDPLIEEVGPWAMIQLADMANFMETLRNFYEWRVPSETAKILGLMTFGLLAITFVPTQMLVRGTTLGCGLAFFTLFPIASRSPEYRLLVSPFKWLFWNIPTHAEWAIAMLQAEGQRHRDNVTPSQEPPKPKVATPDPMGYRVSPTTSKNEPLTRSPIDQESRTDIYGSYDCSHNDKHGKLILNSHGAYFISSIGHKPHFEVSYETIEKLEKVLRVVSKGVSKGLNSDTGEDLKITASGGNEYSLKSMKDRDQAFSQIVGFSQVRWQVVW